MKQRTEDNIMAFVAGLLLFCCLFVGFEAIAGEVYKHKPPPKQVTNNVDRHNEAKSFSDANSESVSGAMADSSASVNSETGDMVSISENMFYSYAQSNRPAASCFVSGDVAGANNGKFGAFGIYWLDSNCWAQEMAKGERDVELNALLKCGSKKYRNSIGFEQPRKERQRYCVDKVMASGLAAIEAEKKRMQADIDKGKADLDFVQREREIERENCEASKDRIVGACFKK